MKLDRCNSNERSQSRTSCIHKNCVKSRKFMGVCTASSLRVSSRLGYCVVSTRVSFVFLLSFSLNFCFDFQSNSSRPFGTGVSSSLLTLSSWRHDRVRTHYNCKPKSFNYGAFYCSNNRHFTFFTTCFSELECLNLFCWSAHVSLEDYNDCIQKFYTPSVSLVAFNNWHNVVCLHVFFWQMLRSLNDYNAPFIHGTPYSLW